MTLGRLCPELRKFSKRMELLKRKAVQVELAWRVHERSLGLRPSMPFRDAVRRNMALLS